MGQSINVLLYGCRIPDVLDCEAVEALREKWEAECASKIAAFQVKLDDKRPSRHNWRASNNAYAPSCPSPDDADPDALIGFYVTNGNGDDDDYSAHLFPAMTFAEMRTTEPTAKILKRCRRRWSRFARWARAQGVEFGKARIWRTRTEVA